MFRWLTERRRRHILETPWPEAWTAIVERNVAAWSLLDEHERARLQDLVRVFLAEKNLEGAGGLELIDEHRVTIAAQACLLILGRDHDLFARLVSIVVYPSVVKTPAQRLSTFAIARGPLDGGTPIAGQAFRGDTVILAWDQVVHGGRDPHDGKNVVVHELAHVIDFLDGNADGTPPLGSRAEYRTWAGVCAAAYLALGEEVERGAPTGVLRAYGATNEAEFFAVATEAFFERPRELAREHRDLYDLLAKFYNLDLATRADRGSAT
ncbi:MAG TPA: M90 family metallopeptidase [Kofleriaceae bacterium]|nr:M90 family metallopeptidase [Kofleriaceae bacterium]